ncbi:hypothetical protein JOQ06_028824, partial [Pogonophryne albipinna]
TALASFNLSLEAGKAHWDIVLHRNHALWGHLSASSATPPPIPLSPPPPGTISQGEPQHGGNPNREELSVAHLGMINLSYVANK